MDGNGVDRGLAAGFEIESAASVRTRFGRLGAYLFLGASVLVPPSLLAIQPYVEASEQGIELAVYGITALGLITGLCLLLAPWQRLDDRWLHFAPLFGVPQILVANLITHGHSSFFYVLVVGYAALVFRSRGVVAGYVGFVWLAMFVPLALTPDDNAVTLGVGLVGAPTLAALALMTVLLREQAERRQLAYHELAWRTIRASSSMLRTERERDALDALADELMESDRESRASTIRLEPRWSRFPEEALVEEALADEPV